MVTIKHRQNKKRFNLGWVFKLSHLLSKTLFYVGSDLSTGGARRSAKRFRRTENRRNGEARGSKSGNGSRRHKIIIIRELPF